MIQYKLLFADQWKKILRAIQAQGTDINLVLFSYFLDIFDAQLTRYVSEKNYLGKSLNLKR